jgi:hypothetical protein
MMVEEAQQTWGVGAVVPVLTVLLALALTVERVGQVLLTRIPVPL